MNGILRLIAADGEREFDLPRQRVTIGSGAQCEITLAVEGVQQIHIALDWDPKRATWLVTASNLPGATTAVNGQIISAGISHPLSHLDAIELPNVFLQFQRVLDEPFRAGAAVQRVALGSSPLTIGRADPAETADPNRLDLDSEETSISRTHAVIEKEGSDYFLLDRSRTGMELNGLGFTRERLVFGDRFRIADYIFEFEGSAIRRIVPEVAGSIRARQLTFSVPTASGRRNILENVSLDIAAGEFIGVLGGSGQGKSTMLHALCGINPPTSGEVRLGGIPLSDRERLREIGVGFVPQDDIVHRELTVEEAITFSAKLRLNLPTHQIRDLVFSVIKQLGLQEHSRKRIADLSGGQRKRVSIAIELLAKPSLLFLDEPSSGLDPATEEALMTLLQSLTLTKLTVVCTTHVLQKAYLFNRLLFIQGGRLVFAGDADEARKFFLRQEAPGAASAQLANSPLERIYSLLAAPGRSAVEWEQLFLQSPYAREAFRPLPPPRPGSIPAGRSPGLKVGPLQTLWLLALRQWRIVHADLLNIAFIIAQPLLIGFLVGWVADESALRLFLCIVATMWFGCSNGAQQIVSELPIFRRERVCGQGLNPYVLSKFSFLSGISLLQAVLLFFTTLLCAQVFHPEKIDRENSLKDLVVRLTPPLPPGAAERAQSEDFDLVEEGSAPQKSAPSTTAAAPVEPKLPSPFVVKTLAGIGNFFQITQNLLDSGPRALTNADGLPMRDRNGQEMTLPGTPIWRVIFVTLGLRGLALAAAAIVGVGIGLAISSLVKNATQAVLWVPLVLIPQILFGGIVVSVPDMTASVRWFSQFMPSFSAQRIADVSAVYGLSTPFLSNRTKTPLFLTSRGDKETVEWAVGERTFSQDYDKLSPVNASWQNLTVSPEMLGQHKHAGTRSEDGFRVEYRDTVEKRRDVRLSKGTVFRSLAPFQIALAVLIVWAAACYGVILYSLSKKQTGK